MLRGRNSPEVRLISTSNPKVEQKSRIITGQAAVNIPRDFGSNFANEREEMNCLKSCIWCPLCTTHFFETTAALKIQWKVGCGIGERNSGLCCLVNICSSGCCSSEVSDSWLVNNPGGKGRASHSVAPGADKHVVECGSAEHLEFSTCCW